MIEAQHSRNQMGGNLLNQVVRILTAKPEQRESTEHTEGR